MKVNSLACSWLLPMIAIGCFVPKSTWAQGGIPLWTNRFGGTASNDDRALAMAVDTNGNVFVTGYSSGAFGGNRAYLTLAYSSLGMPLWTNRYKGPASWPDRALAISAGNNKVYVTGESSLFDGTGAEQYATIAYSVAGTPLWTNRYNGYTSSSAVAALADCSGNCIITGSSAGDVATLAYSSTGVPLWTNRYDGPPGIFESAVAMAVDSNYNVFVTGYSRSGALSEYDYVTLAYSNAGIPLWTNQFEAGGNERSSDIAVDSQGNVIVTGNFVTIKYSNGGVPLWTNYQGFDAKSVVIDDQDRIYVCGITTGGSRLTIEAYSRAGNLLWTTQPAATGLSLESQATCALDQERNLLVTAYRNGNFETMAFSSTGLLLWTSIYDGPSNGQDHPQAVAVDSYGNVFVAGYSQSSAADFDFVTIKYSPTVTLKLERIADAAILSWSNSAFGLQAAVTVAGTFTNVPGATSPLTNPFTGPQQYFRLKAN